MSNPDEFAAGQSRADYIEGLKFELSNAATDDHTKAIKAELKRVSDTKETAVAPKATETA